MTGAFVTAACKLHAAAPRGEGNNWKGGAQPWKPGQQQPWWAGVGQALGVGLREALGAGSEVAAEALVSAAVGEVGSCWDGGVSGPPMWPLKLWWTLTIFRKSHVPPAHAPAPATASPARGRTLAYQSPTLFWKFPSGGIWLAPPSPCLSLHLFLPPREPLHSPRGFSCDSGKYYLHC